MGVTPTTFDSIMGGYTLPTKDIPDPISEFINQLVMMESGGHEDLKVFDTNKKYSYSCLQFQMATWLEQGKKYGINTTSENIMNCSLQKNVAYKMLKDNPNNWKHWYNSTMKIRRLD